MLLFLLHMCATCVMGATPMHYDKITIFRDKNVMQFRNFGIMMPNYTIRNIGMLPVRKNRKAE